jgi:uncharacterized protein (DUF2141 family)
MGLLVRIFEVFSEKYSFNSVFSAASFAVFLWSGSATASGEVRVKVTGISNLVGTIRATLDGSESAFKNDAPTTQTSELAVTNTEVELIFHNVPTGVYAVKVIHDENDDKRLNQNLLGIPSEKYGISNNVMGKFGLPAFKEASFNVSSGETVLSIEISKHKFF